MKHYFYTLLVLSFFLFNTQAYAQYLFYSTNDDYSIKRVNSDGSGILTLYTSATGTPTGITLDAVNNKVYYTDDHTSVSTIVRCEIDGTNKTIIKSSVRAVAIAVDPIGGKLYYTTKDNYTLEMCNLDGSGTSVIYTSATGTPSGVTVDLTNSKVYFTDNHSTVSQIMSCNLDGSGITTVKTGVQAIGIAVDPNGGKLYYTSKDNYTLEMCNLDGSGTSVIYTSATGTPSGVTVDLTNGKVYCSDNHSSVLQIMSCNLDGSGIATTSSSVKAKHLVHEYHSTAGVANNAPTAASFTVSPIYEGTGFAFFTSDFYYNDTDGDPMDHMRVTMVPNHGILWVDADGSNTVNGAETVISNGASISKANLDAGYLKYLNSSGTSSSFNFEVNDGTDYSSTFYTTTLVVVPKPTVTLSLVPNASISENGGSTSIEASLSHSFNRNVTVNLSFSGTTSGSDYSVSASSIVINAGSISGTTNITGLDDNSDEDTESILVDISSVINGTESGTQQVTCTVTDDDNTPVVIASQSFTIAENSTGNIGTIAATDSDAGTIFQSFTITTNTNADGDAHPAFSIDPATGMLSVNDADDIDREKTAQLNIDVSVSDGANTSIAEVVTINLDDVNDVTPLITSGQQFFVPDNASTNTIVGVVDVTDGDITETNFQDWIIVTNVNPDNDGDNAFSIDATQGVIKVNDTGDLIAGQNYSLGITVSDGINTSYQTSVQVNVQLSTSLKSHEFRNVKVYPNPVRGMLNVQAENGANVSLVNLSGESILTTRVSGIKAQFDVSDVEPGVYMVIVHYNGKKEVKKVVVR